MTPPPAHVRASQPHNAVITQGLEDIQHSLALLQRKVGALGDSFRTRLQHPVHPGESSTRTGYTVALHDYSTRQSLAGKLLVSSL